jgi:tRNA nucleotidyltransferase (CCA-adding enzyme)
MNLTKNSFISPESLKSCSLYGNNFGLCEVIYITYGAFRNVLRDYKHL